VCDGYCPCAGGNLVNVSGQARYDAAIASLIAENCACGFPGFRECVNHQCTVSATAVDASVSVDAATAVDAPVSIEAAGCVYVDLSTYDRSCKADSDCIDITPGSICPGSCACGGAAVNIDGQARYQAAIKSVGLGFCQCPIAGPSYCVMGECTHCNLGSGQGCTDGG
jgi:hypothetical protein